MDALDLRRRLHSMGVRAAQLSGMLEADRSNCAVLTTEVSLAKGRMGLSEEIGRIFDAMQQLANSRSVGAFENLLTAVLNDVLPQEGTVRLLPEYKSNTTYLDIALEKNGGIEDILDGNGGAVTNVVCAGLRFAALSRTRNRRLMVLDEPDCWLKPDRVPNFVNVVDQVSTDMGAQTFFITHHDPAFFEGKMNVVKFYADEDGKVHAQPLAPLTKNWEDDDQPGIRGIELINVRRHEHTFVPCFPGATAFIGDNNLGKSTAIGSALKAVAYNESDDTFFRHGCTEAKIILHLEGQQRLEWSRGLNRSPAVMYKLYKGDTLITEGRPKSRSQAPDWVESLLNITRVDDLDLQIGSQKKPVFLLNDPAPRRAQILSVGKESSHLKTLMKSYEVVKAEDRETIKLGELQLARLKAKLTYLERVTPVREKVDELTSGGEQLLTTLETRGALEKLIASISTLANGVKALKTEVSVLEAVPAAPDLQDLTQLESLCVKLQRGAHLEALPELPALPEVPALHELTELLALGSRIAKAQQAVNAAPAGIPELPALPGLADGSALESVLNRVSLSTQTEVAANAEAKKAEAEFAVAQDQLTKTQQELGECPLCGSAFGTADHHAH